MACALPGRYEPMTGSDDLAYLGAVEAAALFRARSLSPVELLDALIERARLIEPQINAFSAQRIDAARAQARIAEGLFLSEPERAGPLEGIPVALKNEHELIGDSTDQGSLLLKGRIDQTNAPITDRLLDAGAVIHAKTNVPEFMSAVFTRSRLHGVTRNPWRLDATPGGSSGGAGAALAAGLTTLASGSDIAGSIRIPSSFCGVVGLKPSYGRVPEAMFEFAMNTYNHNGPLARSVADCALMFNVINGAHPADPATCLERVQVDLPRWNLNGLRIAVSSTLGRFKVTPDILTSFATLCRKLEDAGASVEPVDLPWGEEIAAAAQAGLAFTMGRWLARIPADQRHLATDYALQLADAGLATSPEAYFDHFSVMAAMHRDIEGIFRDYDFLLCPTMAVDAIPAEGGADPLADIWSKAMTWPFNVLSRHPVLSLPCGIATNGVPIGVQIVGARMDDGGVLAAGAAVEQLLGLSPMRPPIHRVDLTA